MSLLYLAPIFKFTSDCQDITSYTYYIADEKSSFFSVDEMNA